MAVYENTCGPFRIVVGTNGWMGVSFRKSDDIQLYFKTADLYDLKHLVDMAIKAVQNEEAKG